MWINVKEKLPSTYEDVLVHSCSGKISVMYLPEKKEGYCWGWYPGGLPIGNSTHWMKLPDFTSC